MRLADLAGRRVAVLGAGADVAAALGVIRAAGPASLVMATDHPAHDRLDDVDTHDLAEGPPPGVDVFVRSPGFCRHVEWLSAASARPGVAVTTPLDLWLGEAVASGRRVATVTGTKGKSTTTTWCARLGAPADPPLSVAGNLGPPVFSDGWDTGGPVVLEVSSYQAADLHHVGELGVLTSLAEDHLSWHGGWDRYVADKLRCFTNDGGRVPRVLVAADQPTALAACADVGLDVEAVAVPDGWRSRWSSAPDHALANLALARRTVEAMTGVVAGDDALDAAVHGGVDGRLEVIGRVGRATVVDDPLASNPFAAAASLRWVRTTSGVGGRCVVLVGGEDRAVSPTPLRDEVAQWSPGAVVAVALPDTGADLAAGAGLEVIGRADSLDAALGCALEALGEGDGVVLFAPGAPTPGRATWRDRSAALRAAVTARAKGVGPAESG